MTDADQNVESNPPLKTESQQVSITVADDATDTRLDVYLAEKFPEYSRVQLRKWINAAAVTVNGKRAKASMRLRTGQTIEATFPELPKPGPEPENIPLDILFEDDDLAVINKPHGMVVHPSKGHWSGTLTAALAYHFQQLSSVGGASRPGIVHRLDRDTSGVILVAKNDAAHLKLAKQFELREVQKQYFAIAKGTIDRDRDKITQPIGAHPYHRERMAIRADHATSRDAETFFEVAERFPGFTALHVFPKTGRTHQIRIHMAHVGCPILCDPLYAGHRMITVREAVPGSQDDQVLLDRLALHAAKITFRHPTNSQAMEFAAPLPAELEHVLTVLRTIPPALRNR